MCKTRPRILNFLVLPYFAPNFSKSVPAIFLTPRWRGAVVRNRESTMHPVLPKRKLRRKPPCTPGHCWKIAKYARKPARRGPSESRPAIHRLSGTLPIVVLLQTGLGRDRTGCAEKTLSPMARWNQIKNRRGRHAPFLEKLGIFF